MQVGQTRTSQNQDAEVPQTKHEWKEAEQNQLNKHKGMKIRTPVDKHRSGKEFQNRKSRKSETMYFL